MTLKKIFIISGILSGLILTGYCSYQFGYVSGYHDVYNVNTHHLKEAIRQRTENYLPDCNELKNRGIPRIVKKDNDYFFVHASKDYFYVFGININPGKPPQVYWWGAGSEEPLKTCTDSDNKKGSSEVQDLF